jgi:hypothetical protein
MAIADGSQHRVQLVAESTYGTTPSSPTFTDFQHNGLTGRLSKTEIRSQTLSSDRQYSFVRHGNKSVGASIPFELSYGSHDTQMEATLGGTWSTKVDTGAITIDVAPSGSNATFTRSSGDYTSDPIAVGDVITVSGFSDAGGNGRFVATNVTATVVTATPLEGQTVPTESGGGDEQIVVEATLENGTTRRYFTIEEYFADVDLYVYTTGQNFSAMSLEIAPDSIVTGSFDLIGKDIEPATDTQKASATDGTPSTAEPLDSFTGEIRDNGTVLAVVQSLSVNTDNQMERRNVVFDDTSLLPSIRRFMAGGSATVYFEDETLYNKFISETASSLQFELTDPDGNTYWWYLPNIKYMSGDPEVNDDGSINLTMDFSAVKDSVTGKTMTMQRIPA